MEKFKMYMYYSVIVLWRALVSVIFALYTPLYLVINIFRSYFYENINYYCFWEVYVDVWKRIWDI